MSRDGPHDNIIKFKSPMCFNVENAATLVKQLDLIFTELAEGKMSQHADKNGLSSTNGEPTPKKLKTNGTTHHVGEGHLNGQPC